MIRRLAFLIIISFICSCSFLKKIKSYKKNDNIIGIWTEHWGKDSHEPETDVNYVDTLKIDINGNGEIIIICINNSNYIYSNIICNETHLSFQMENKVDPEEKFIIQYSLVLTKKNIYKGEIINSRGKKVNIILKKHIKDF
jgi:hypothetical protein